MHDIVLFYDGKCRLCSAAVQFVLKNDQRKEIKFSMLQGSLAQKLIPDKRMTQNDPKSLILWSNGQLYYRSDAFLEICKRLGGAWRFVHILTCIPLFLRDGLYNFIAKNRYRWFGKYEHCMVPTKELLSRFID